MLMGHANGSVRHHTLKDVKGPQLPTGAWPGGPYKGCETMMAAI